MKKITQITTFFILLITSLNTKAQTVSTLAGSTEGNTDGAGTVAQFYYPFGVAVDGQGNVYVADYGNHKIRKITPSGIVSTLAGGSSGFADGTGTAAQFNGPYGVCVDFSGNVYVADIGNQKIRKITPLGVVTSLAGSETSYGSTDGVGSVARFNNPTGLAADTQGNVYVADSANQKIRKITPSGVVSTLAGTDAFGYADGIGTTAQFYNPSGVAVDAQGNLYVTDSGNNKVRKITASGEVSTLAGSTSGFADGVGTTAQFNSPAGVAVDAQGNVYVTDHSNFKVRKITPTGTVTTLAGSASGFADGTGTLARFSDPIGIAVDTQGNVYVADYSNYKIRKITTSTLATTDFDFGSNVSVYPNPSNGVFNFNIDKPATMAVFDTHGKQVLSKKTASGATQIDLSSNTSGVYILKAIDTNNKTETLKLIKK